MKISEKGNSIGLFNLPKGILMFLIIAGHSLTTFYHPWEHEYSQSVFSLALALLNVVTYGFAPMFFMVCGYNARATSMKKCIRQQVKFCLKPYVLVAAAVCAATLAKSLIDHDSILRRLRYYVLPYFLCYCPGERPFLGLNMASIGPMWFFVTFAFASILLNAVLQEKRIWAQVAMVASLGIIGVEMRFITLPFCFQQTLICTGYMYLGWLMKKQKFFQTDIPTYLAVLVTVFTVVFCATGFIEVSQNVWGRGVSDLLASYFAGIVMMPVMLSLNRFHGKLSECLCWMGKNALYICCLHTVAFVSIPWEKVAQRMPNAAVGFTFELVFHLVFALGGCWLVEKVQQIGR